MQTNTPSGDPAITIQIAKWATAQLIENWLIEALGAVVLAFIVSGFMMLLGKHSLLGAAKKKLAFYGLVGLVGFVVIHICVCATDYVFAQRQLTNKQLDEIRKAVTASVPPREGFKAGLIFMTPIGTMTNSIGTNTTITPSMSGIGSAKTKLDDRGVTMLMLVKVDNPGQSSVAWNWKVSVLLPTGGEPIPAAIPSVILNSKEPLPTIIGPYNISMEDQLIQALAVNPMPHGGGKIGWLVFNVAGFNEMPEGAVVILTFEDVFGNETKLQHKWERTKQ